MIDAAPDPITFYPDDWEGDRDPWLKFYPDLWNGDLGLMSCSSGAQALLVRLMGVMHHAKPYAFLTFSGEKPGIKCRTFEDISYLKSVSRAAGVSVKSFQKLLSELIEQGALKECAYGVYSKRMRLEWEKTQKGRQAGKGGGNPALTAARVKGGVNPPVKGGLNTRYKKKNKSKSKDICANDLQSFEREFDELFWPLVAKKQTRAESLEKFIALRASAVPLEDLTDGLLEYQREREAEETELKFYMQPKKFLGPGEHWQEYAEKARARRREAEKAERRRRQVESPAGVTSAERPQPVSPEKLAAAKAALGGTPDRGGPPPGPVTPKVPDEVRRELEEKRRVKREKEAMACASEKASATEGR